MLTEQQRGYEPMKTIDPIYLNLILERLDDALAVINEVEYASDEEREEDYTKSYPYAAGWAKSALRGTYMDLKAYTDDLKTA